MSLQRLVQTGVQLERVPPTDGSGQTLTYNNYRFAHQEIRIWNSQVININTAGTIPNRVTVGMR